MGSVSGIVTFSNGTSADADEVNGNFTALKNFVEDQTVQKDGSVAMQGRLTLHGSDPTAPNHAVRKAYLDSRLTTLRDDEVYGPYVYARVENADIDDGIAQTVDDPNEWLTIKFQQLPNNVGGAYNLSSGVFTAPKDGLYIVSLTVGMQKTQTAYFRTRILVGNTGMFHGPRFVPNELGDTAPSGQLVFQSVSHVVHASAGMTICPQFSTPSLGTYKVGKTLSIGWLHGWNG